MNDVVQASILTLMSGSLFFFTRQIVKGNLVHRDVVDRGPVRGVGVYPIIADDPIIDAAVSVSERCDCTPHEIRRMGEPVPVQFLHETSCQTRKPPPAPTWDDWRNPPSSADLLRWNRPLIERDLES